VIRDPSEEWALTQAVHDLFLVGLLVGLLSLVAVAVAVAVVPWLTPLWLLMWVALSCPAASEWVWLRVGGWRVAAWQAWFGNVRWYRQRSAAWPALGALAALRDPTLWPELEQAIRDARVLTSGHLFAMGLQAWHAGEDDEARDLMWLVLFVDNQVQPRPLPAWATEWLLCEALSRGDLDGAAALRGHPRTRWTRRCTLALRLARGEGGGATWLAWLFAGAWWRTRRALPGRPAPAAATPTTDDPVRALVVARGVGGVDAVTRALQLWAAELDGPGAGHGEVEQEVLAELADLVRAHAVPLPPDSALRTVVLADLRDEVGALADELQRRTSAKQPLPLPDEVRAWCLVLRRYDQIVALGGEMQASHAFGLVHPSLNNHAVWLHNRRGNQIVANAMYRWAWHRAAAAGHRGQQLLYDNVGCGPGDGTLRRWD